MPFFAEYNEQNVVFAVTESVQQPTGNFIQTDSYDVLGWVNNDGVLEPPSPAIAPTTFGRIITVLAYSSRFTQAEEIAIETAAQSGGVDGAAASLALRKLGWAGYINLDEPRTIAATQILEPVGLIGVGRAAEILGPPVYSTEAFG